MKVIFLDVDGVLNCDSTTRRTKNGWCFVDREKVELLAKIVKATDAKIVLDSTWREGWNDPKDTDFIELKEELAECGLTPYDHTKFDSEMNWNQRPTHYRTIQITDWLIKNKDIVESFVILEDYEYIASAYNDNLVKTAMSHGLTKEDADRAIAILNKV